MTDTATPQETGNQESTPWYHGADDLTTGYVQNKGWASPLEAVRSYQNLEKLLGADRAGRTVVLPDEKASPEDMGKFYERLGRPAEPAGYNLKIPEVGGSKDFATAAAAKFHELGLSTKQGEALAEWWNSQSEGIKASQEAAQAAKFQEDDQALRKEWGAAFDQNLLKARTFVQGMGFKADMIDQLQAAWGHKATMEFFHNLGGRMGEADFVSGQPQGFTAAMTPAQAQAKIHALRQDRAFVGRYMKNDVEAVSEMKRLHAWAYPEE